MPTETAHHDRKAVRTGAWQQGGRPSVAAGEPTTPDRAANTTPHVMYLRAGTDVRSTDHLAFLTRFIRTSGRDRDFAGSAPLARWQLCEGTAMSHVVVVPSLLATAATDLEGIASALSAANAAAAAPTTGVLAAG